jgi:hypothetical protein
MTAERISDTGPEQLRRSIDALQRLYTIVVGLAVTEALRSFLVPAAALAPAVWWTNWRSLGILLVTIVPFYHGANAHLDQTYLYGFDDNRRGKRYALVIDFFVLFGEGVLFFVLALSLNAFERFVHVFEAVLLTDVAWALFVYISGDHAKRPVHAIQWGLLNLVTFALVAGAYDSAWLLPATKDDWVFGIAVVRMFGDYFLCWDFYMARYPMPATADKA